ncbi:MAG: hypothetical protein E7254_06415 [Lachnospiraceae bacterium]|nr:hypothetical protein [Lachnospiraceae bacterium]
MRDFFKAGRRFVSSVCAIALMVTMSGPVHKTQAASVTVELNGYQISTSWEGYRTIYSITDPSNSVSSCGLLYGLVEDTATSDMVVNSSNSGVYDFTATSAGIISKNYSKNANAVSRAMTMKLVKDANFYNAEIRVRAYAKLKDGTVSYSPIHKITVVSIADYLYQGIRMPNGAAHEYLYNNILKVCNPNYQVVEYDWNDDSYIPGEIAGETETVATTQAPTTQAPTQAPTTKAGVQYTTAIANDWPNLGNWSAYFGDWAGTATGAYKLENGVLSMRVDSNDKNDWLIQARYTDTVTSGKTYKVSVDVKSSKAASFLMKEDASNENNSSTFVNANVSANTKQTITGTFPMSTSNIKLMFNLGQIDAGTVIEFSNVRITEVSGQTTTTQAPTQAPTTKAQTGNGPAQPVGLTFAGNADLPYYFAWAGADGVTYNFYVDGRKVAEGITGGAFNAANYSSYLTAGEHTIGITAVNASGESAMTTIKHTFSGNTATQQQPTSGYTENPTDNSGSYPEDPSIEKPFGMVVDSPKDGYVHVVWGAGAINCYNVYVDGERRRTAVPASSITMPVYFEGTHTVTIRTLSNSKESLPTTLTVNVRGVGERETEAPTVPMNLRPAVRYNYQSDKILIQMNNKTNGQYSDNDIYWCLFGKDADDKMCYVDTNGNLIRGSVALNTGKIGNRDYAPVVCHKLSECDHFYIGSINSGRMYLSYGKPMYIGFNQDGAGNVGYAGPDLNNKDDPNADTLFEFEEFTISGKFYWGNTTRVDYFCFPTVTRLLGHTQYVTYDKTVGDMDSRADTFAAFRAEAPAAFQTLVGDKRIMAPCKTTFNEGQIYGNYFDGYINQFWSKYSNEDLVINLEQGAYIGRVYGDRMHFRSSNGDGTVYYVDKPSTQDVLEGRGAFNRHSEESKSIVEKAIEAQLCAAFNRGVATSPADYYDISKYYKNDINNFYAGFMHRHSFVGLAYGFCYDDVNDQSTLLQTNDADALIIDLKW